MSRVPEAGYNNEKIKSLRILGLVVVLVYRVQPLYTDIKIDGKELDVLFDFGFPCGGTI